VSLYFEDFVLESSTASRGRTITESDIVTFAGLSGDFVELHMNEEFARKGPFGQRIAHGALIFSISTGLMVQMNQIQDTVIAFYGIDRLRFTKPVFIGDTIHVIKKVIAREAKPPDRGVVTFETTVLNQHDDTVLVYRDKLMVRARG
jgi:3-hydroxybutyryl-CoA dehydratase